MSAASVLSILSAALACALLVLALPALLHRWRRRRAERREKEWLDAYRELHVRLDFRLEQARFSYRPATGELVLDARAAGLHGLFASAQASPITVPGWHHLPASARAAGHIDDALHDGLAHRQPVRCEYLARTAGQADRHLILTAVPLATDGVMLGAVAERPGPGYVDGSGWDHAAETPRRAAGSDDRSWMSRECGA